MRTIDVHRFLDEHKVTRVHIAVLATTMLMMFIDGFDVFMLGRIAPAIAKGFGEPTVAMTKVFVAQSIGLTISAFCMALAADRFGRKRMMVIACFMFGLLTLSALLTSTLWQLAFTRFLDGLFLGGTVLTSSSLITEIAPRRWRATMVSLLYVGYSLGNACGAWVALLVERHGWQIGFWIGGLVPLLIGGLFLFVVPESPRFLVRRNPRDPRIAKFLARLDPRLDLSTPHEFTAGSEAEAEAAKKGGPRLLFANSRWRMTLLLWSTTFITMGTTAINAAWQVTFFQELGSIPMARFAAVSTFMFVGMLAGTLTVGPMADRFGPTRIISILSVGLALALCSVGRLPFGTPIFIIALFAQGYCMAGAQSTINALIAQSYPTAVRATGFGWAGMVGRLSGVILPWVGSFALVYHLTLAQALTIMGLPSLIVAVIMIVLGRVRRSLGIDKSIG